MDEAPNFHMTIVTKKRRSRSGGSADPGGSPREGGAQPASSRGSAGETARSPRRSGHSGSHRHRYDDYGTVDLGAISPVDAASVQPHEQGRQQREFLEKYSPVLNRKYKKGKGISQFTVIAGVVLIALLMLVFFMLRSPKEDSGEPRQETIQVIDINDLN